MPAVARREASSTSKEVASTRTVSVVALTHAFQNLKRYHRGDELDITLAEGQPLPAWCIAADDAPRDRDGRIRIADLPLFFPANARS